MPKNTSRYITILLSPPDKSYYIHTAMQNLSNMVDVLNNCGIEEIKCLHEPFDEASMNAVLVESTDEFDDNIVLDVLQKGYMYKDKVIRPAMVKVNKVETETLDEQE